MIDHNELMQEMEYIDTLSRNDRIKLASKRRKDQLSTHTKWMKTDDYMTTTRPRPKNRKGLKFTLDLELMDIAARNALDEMRDLLKNGGNPNQMNHDGLTALHQCCIDGSLEMVTLLVKNGANVNVKDRDLWSPLHAAATCGHFKIVTLLIKSGADLTAINGDGDMPHDIAEDEVMQQYLENELAKRGITEDTIQEIRNAPRTRMIADINEILSTGGDINQSQDQGGTMLHVAIANGFNDVVSLLLENGASVTARDEDGWEPIHAAAYWCNQKAIDMLIHKQNVDIRSLTDNGETPYDICDDPEFKIYINQIVSQITHKYSSVKTYDAQELKDAYKQEKFVGEDESTSFNDEYEDTVTDTLTFNFPKDESDTRTETNDYDSSDSEEDGVEIRNPVGENVTINAHSNPLINKKASEFTERRNSVKEAKHKAPRKRASFQDKNSTHNGISLIQKGYEHSLPTIEATDEYMETEQSSNRMGDQKSSGETINPAQSWETKNGNLSNKRDTSTKEVPPPAYERHDSKSRAPSPLPDQREQHSFRTELNNNHESSRSRTMQKSLLDLKKQRIEARQLHRQGSFMEGRSSSGSTFYDSSQIYEPPPSPTMIRYRLKMDTPVRVNDNFIKEKKCTIM